MSKRTKLLQAALPILMILGASPSFAIQGTYHSGVCEYDDGEGGFGEADCCASNVDCGASPSDGSDCSVLLNGVIHHGDVRDPVKLKKDRYSVCKYPGPVVKRKSWVLSTPK